MPDQGYGIGMELRHPTEQEHEAVNAFVQAVVDETYGGLWTSSPVRLGATDWSSAWLAIMEHQLAGVALTSGASIDDLWVAAGARGTGVGVALLRRCECEIRRRNVSRARLRVVSSNIKAIGFYRAHGWTAEREYAHESLPVTMTDMGKDL